MSKNIDISPKSKGQRLRQMANETGDTRAEMGDLIGISGQAIQGAITTGSIKDENLQALANHYGYSIAWLMTGQLPKKQPPNQHEVNESSKEYAAQPTPWPQSPDQINLAIVNDIADRVCAATGADIYMIKKEIFAGIIEHYKKKEQKPDE